MFYKFVTHECIQTIMNTSLSYFTSDCILNAKTWLHETFNELSSAAVIVGLTVTLIWLLSCSLRSKHIQDKVENTRIILKAFDLAKAAQETGNIATVILLTEKHSINVNQFWQPQLSLFLCSCLSGQRRLIQYMLTKGGDVEFTTPDGDTPLYLATFGILGAPVPDVSALDDLLRAGCDINARNHRGYTPLHRAASKGNVVVTDFLLRRGADPYCCSVSGVYPIDSAINAGHVRLAERLTVRVENDHVWEIVDPHTPPRITLGLQSPNRKQKLESSRPVFRPSYLVSNEL